MGAPYYAPPPSRPFLGEVDADPGRLRIAFTSQPLFPAVVHPDCVKGLESTVKLCQDLGHEVTEATLPVDGKALAQAFVTVVCVATRAEIEKGEDLLNRKATFRDFEPVTWALALLGGESLLASSREPSSRSNIVPGRPANSLRSMTCC